MSSKQVLDVGNCDMDHRAIRELITDNFDASVARAHNRQEVLAAMRQHRFDLVLINRRLDQDNTEGIEILREIKADRQWRDIPVMLVTNLTEWHQKAVSVGGEPGFGKAKLQAPETLQILGRFLPARH
jgi:CheY-like chemotaxis protein